MSGLYPPGVTGNEFAISGPDYDETEHRECTNVNVGLWIVQHDFMLTPGTVGPGTPVYEVPFEVCPWKGEVDVQGYRGSFWWTCPLCGHEHTEETDIGPDPDDERDRQRDYEMLED